MVDEVAADVEHDERAVAGLRERAARRARARRPSRSGRERNVGRGPPACRRRRCVVDRVSQRVEREVDVRRAVGRGAVDEAVVVRAVRVAGGEREGQKQEAEREAHGEKWCGPGGRMRGRTSCAAGNARRRASGRESPRRSSSERPPHRDRRSHVETPRRRPSRRGAPRRTSRRRPRSSPRPTARTAATRRRPTRPTSRARPRCAARRRRA